MGDVWYFISRFITVYSWAIFVYIVMTWLASGVSGPVRDIYRALAAICEPFLALFRRVLPPVMVGSAGLDLSPVIALFVLQIVANMVGRL